MPAKHSRHIALTGPLAAWIDEQVARGQYASASDLVRAAVRLLKAQEDQRDAPSLPAGIVIPLPDHAVQACPAEAEGTDPVLGPANPTRPE